MSKLMTTSLLPLDLPVLWHEDFIHVHDTEFSRLWIIGRTNRPSHVIFDHFIIRVQVDGRIGEVEVQHGLYTKHTSTAHRTINILVKLSTV